MKKLLILFASVMFVVGLALPAMAGTLTYSSGSKFTMYNGPYGVWITPTGSGALNPGSLTWSPSGSIAPVPGDYTANATPPSASLFNIFTFFGAPTYHYTTGTENINNSGAVVTLTLGSMYVWWNGNYAIPMPASLTSGTYVSGSPTVGTKEGSWNPVTGWLDMWGQGVIPAAFPNFLGVYHVKGFYTGTIHPIPEPASLLLIGSGLAGLAVLVRRKR